MQIKIVKCSDDTKWYADLVGAELEARYIDTHGRAILIATSNKLRVNKDDFEVTGSSFKRRKETYTPEERAEIFTMFEIGTRVDVVSNHFSLKLAVCYQLKDEYELLKGVYFGSKTEVYYTEEEAQRNFCASYEDLSPIEKKIYDSL